MPRYIDVDAFRKEHRMNEHCEDCERNSRECQYNDFSMMDFCGWLDDAPIADVISIDALAVWLAGYHASPPEYALKETGALNPIDPASTVFTPNQIATAWAYHLRKLVESGLMETGGIR